MSITRERSSIVFQRLERDLIKLSSKSVPENIHRFRTATRRLQTLLQELSPERGRKQKKLLKLLARLRKRAGKVRDVDVQLAALRDLKFSREPRRKTQLVHHLIELRNENEKKLRKALDKATLREVKKRLKRAEDDFDPAATLDALTVARRMLEQVEHRQTALSEQALHRYRIAGKRARYAAEFAAKSAKASQMVGELKQLQDALGDWRDWLTLAQTATDQLGDVRESPLVAELRNVSGAKFHHAVTVLSQVRARLSLDHKRAVPTLTRASAKGAAPIDSAA